MADSSRTTLYMSTIQHLASLCIYACIGNSSKALLYVSITQLLVEPHNSIYESHCTIHSVQPLTEQIVTEYLLIKTTPICNYNYQCALWLYLCYHLELWSEHNAVSTPWNIEINKPGLIIIQDSIFKTIRCEILNTWRNEAKQPLSQGLCIPLVATVNTDTTTTNVSTIPRH